MSRRFMAALGAAVITLSALTTTASAQTCIKVVTNPAINGTSTNGRAPTTNFQYVRAHYLITAAELAAAGYTNGASPTVIGWVYSTANDGGTAPLTVYMENTADTTNLKSATWATAISTMQVVHNAPVTLPNVVGPVDITMTGGTPFTYTGGGLYVAFDWGQYPGATTATAVISCNTSLTGGLKGAQSNTAAPTTLTASNFRPITRLNGAPSLLNDAAVTAVYSMGALPFCSVGPQTIQAVITNLGFNPQTNLQVTLNVTGTDTFTDTQVIPTLDGCGSRTTVTFLSYTPSAAGSNTIAVSVPADDGTTNDSISRPSNNTTSDYSYKYPGAPITNGVGLGTVGAFVAKFTSTVPDTITDVDLEFFAITATTYRVAIYADNAGLPSPTVIYQDAVDRTVTAAGPVTITLPSPMAYGPGTIWVGIQQTNTTNANLSFDQETPIRPATFFFATALPVATWIDFAPNNSFKLNVGIKTTACGGQPCPADIAGGDNQVDVNDLLAVINAWGACPAPCPPSCAADIDPDGGDCTVDVNDLLDVINAWGPCP